MPRLRGGATRKEIKAIKAKQKAGKPITFNGLVLLLMNTENPNTNKPFTEKEAKRVANMANKKYVHKFPYNAGNRPKK